MNILHISLRNLRLRILSSTLTMVSIMLGTALIAAIWLMIAAADKHYKASQLGFKAVVGPKEGSPLALVLCTVLNLGASPGVVPLSVYRELHDGRIGKKLGLRYAIPQARGDQYEGFPLIGTTDEMFTKFQRSRESGQLEFAAGKRFTFGHQDLLAFAEEMAKRKNAEEGSNGGTKPPVESGGAQKFDPKFFSVIGSRVAAKTGLKIGDHFLPVHGSSIVAKVHEESACEIVGILKPTGSSIDASIFLPISGFVSFEGHGESAVRETAKDATADDLQLTAIIVDTRDHLGGNKLRYEFQTRRDAQVAWPHLELANLYRMIGGGTQLLVVVSWLVLAVAAMSILVALYNTMNERRREIAIMRALGARRLQIIQIILSEAFLVSGVGGILGIGLCHGAALVFRGTVEQSTSVPLDWTAFSVAESYLVVGVAILGSLSGILPAVKGSTTEVAENLGPTS